MPIVLAGSKITSEQVLDVFGMKKPWGRSGKGKVEVREIDRVHVLPLLSNFHLALLALVFVLVMAAVRFDALEGLGEGVWR